MLPKKFKLLFLPAETSKKFELNFTNNLIIACIGAFILMFLSLSMSVGFLLHKTYSAHKLSALNYRNSELNEQLQIANEHLQILSTRVEDLGKNGNDLRSLMHMPLLDSETQQMGIGGPLPFAASVDIGSEKLLEKIATLERQVSLQENSLFEVSKEMETQEQYVSRVPSIKPLKNGTFSSLFGHRRDPFTGQWEPHRGLDINAPRGTPVYSTADGRVTFVGRRPAYGKTIVINHGNGYETRYAHLNHYYVQKGQKIKRNDPIAEVGSTGRSTGPHLHYEVILRNQFLDPLDFMFDGYEMAWTP